MPVWMVEAMLLFAAFYVIVTQVIWPSWRGTPMFPVFRREHYLHRVIEDNRQKRVERNLEKESKK